jgi:hypothetical protein
MGSNPTRIADLITLARLESRLGAPDGSLPLFAPHEQSAGFRDQSAPTDRAVG